MNGAVSLEITTRGIPAAQARLKRQEEGLIFAMYAATHEGIDVTVDFVRSFTPIMTVNRGGSHRFPGELMASIRGEMVIETTSRVVGRVFTDIDWAPFVERGTLEHGRARHMFQFGQRSARPLVKMIFESHIGTALA